MAQARDYYETTIALPDATAGNAIKPLASVKVSVVPRGATDIPNSLVDIYQADYPSVVKGPDPKSGASGTNPFTTAASGSVRFWADGPAEYDIVFEDTITPARVTDRIPWNAIPAKAGSIPTSYLAQDGGPTTGIKQGHLSTEVVMQQIPIGGCMDWWRPPSPVLQPPAGFEVAAGQSVQYEVAPARPSDQPPTAAVLNTVTLPNLQNCFIIGAVIGKADGTGAIANDLPGSGPGIRGTGGSNLPKNLAHGHQTPMVDHYHNVAVPNHYHGSSYTTGGHSHGVSVSGGAWSQGANSVGDVNKTSGSVVFTRTPDHAHYVGFGSGGGTDYAGNLGVYGTTTWVDGPGGSGITGNSTSNISAWTAGQNGYSATTSTTWTADPGTEFRPYFVGLLRLIKVRRTA